MRTCRSVCKGQYTAVPKRTLIEAWKWEKGEKRTHLVRDVIPVVLGAQIFEILLEQGTHLDDTIGHALDLAEPLLVELGVAQDLAGDARPVDGRVGVQWTDEDLDLGVDALLLVGRVGDDAEGTDSLAVETHVLGEGLREREAVALLDEQADRVGVTVGVAGSEALVGHVEERVVALLLDDLADLLPLLLRGVDAGRVVGAGVQEEEGVVWCGLQVSDQAVEVEADGVLVVVLVLLDLEAGVAEDGLVVGPRWGWNVDRLRVWVEALEEGPTYSQCARAGDGLCDGDAVFLESLAVGAVGQHGGLLGEAGDTGDAGIFLVEVFLDELLLGGAYGGEDVGLAFVVACRRIGWLVSQTRKANE